MRVGIAVECGVDARVCSFTRACDEVHDARSKVEQAAQSGLVRFGRSGGIRFKHRLGVLYALHGYRGIHEYVERLNLRRVFKCDAKVRSFRVEHCEHIFNRGLIEYRFDEEGIWIHTAYGSNACCSVLERFRI